MLPIDDADASFSELDHSCQSHSLKILHGVNEHRKADSKLCDVIIQVNEKKFPSHRAILAACSPYFLAMFNGSMKESTEKIIVLKDINETNFEKIINFVYTGNLELTIENVEDLLGLSSELQFVEVQEMCCKFLMEQLDPVNCIGIRKFIKLYNCKKFLSKIDEFIQKHFLEVIESDEFVQLPLDGLKKALASSLLNVTNEVVVYNSVMKWINHDVESREGRLPKLLSLTCLPLISKDFLMNTIDREPMIKASFKCRDLLDEAKNYHLQPENHSSIRSWRTRPRLCAAGLLFAVGGRESDEILTAKVEAFSAYDNSWTRKAPLNHPRIQLGITELNGKIYACGGGDGIKRLDTVEVYSLEKNKWEKGEPMKTARSGLVAKTMCDSVFIMGGFDGRSCLNVAERFLPSKGVWENVAPSIVARSFPGASVLDKRLYMVGGNDGTAFLDTCEIYDPSLNKWVFTTPLTGTRAGLGCASLDGILYVAGGYDGSTVLNKVEMLDPRVNEWQEIAPMIYSRDGCCMTSYAGFLIALGGVCGHDYLNTAEYYDPSTNQWSHLKPMITSRAVTSVCVLPHEDTFI